MSVIPRFSALSFGVALAVLLLLVGAIQLTRADSAAAQEKEVLAVQPVSGSGISGTATLTAVGNDVEVVVEVTGLVEGNNYVSASYHSPSAPCASPSIDSSDVFPGTDGGVTYVVPDTSLSDIFSVAVREVADTGDLPGVVVACGNRPAVAEVEAAPAEPPTTGSAPNSGDSGFALSYLLTAGWAMALLGSSALALGAWIAKGRSSRS